MTILQRTPEWHAAREGKLTASVFAQAAGLGPQSRQAAWRRLMGLDDFEDNVAMQWGTEHEPVALAAYLNANTPITFTPVGFVPHPEIEWIGCSPDGLIGADGLVEIKCPFSQKIYEEIPPYYMAQVQGQMEITDRSWCDFVVWTPTEWSVRRVHRSYPYWKWMYVRLADFWTWVQAQVEPPRDTRPKSKDIPVVAVDDEQRFIIANE